MAVWSLRFSSRLSVDSAEHPSFICMAHFGSQIKREFLGANFVTDFRQENHTLEKEKASSATRADGTSVVQKWVDFSPYFLGELLDPPFATVKQTAWPCIILHGTEIVQRTML